MAAFDLELLKHQLFSILGQERLVEKTSGKVLSVCADKHISAVKATEQADDSVKALIGFSLVHSFETHTQLVVAVSGDIMRGCGLLVHKVLEGYVSILLELDVVEERFLNHNVDLSLEGEKSLSELNRILD